MSRAVMEQALEALQKALPIVQADAQMMADITRHAPLDPESQAKHDSTEYESERLARQMPEVIAALEAALAEQARPAAWAITDRGNVIYLNDDREDSEREFRKYGSRSGMALLPLYTAPPAPVAPPGWRMVPVEPTPEMIEQGYAATITGTVRGQWAAMLAAAPVHQPVHQPVHGWTDADADAARLALELECLLTDKDVPLPTASRWWDSAHEALRLHRERLAAAPEVPR